MELAMSQAYNDFLRDLDEEDLGVETPQPENSNEPPLPHAAAAAAVLSPTSSSASIQYAAMTPGTVVHIQVGNVQLARKAWKKRRRSGSPLLVPCSILSVDRISTVRWNVLYLLQKFGQSRTNSKTSGIQLSFAEITQRYRSHLKGSLYHHATLLGFDTATEFLLDLFPPHIQESYGVQIVTKQPQGVEGVEDSSDYWISAPLSRLRAQKRANQAAVLQFQDAYTQQQDDADHAEDEAQKDRGPEDTLWHTGLVRNKNPAAKTISSTPVSSTASEAQDGPSQTTLANFYQLQPLSAALRVTPKDGESVETTVAPGTLYSAIVLDYDPHGDAGAPFLTLSLTPSPRRVFERLAPSTSATSRRRNPKTTSQQTPPLPPLPGNVHVPTVPLASLHMGDGPIPGTVVGFVKGGALVDCSIGRTPSNSNDDDMIPVLGVLRFQDTRTNDDDEQDQPKMEMEQDDDEKEEEALWEHVLSVTEDETDDDDDDDEEVEETEDITHLFEIGEDGSLVFKDEEEGGVAAEMKDMISVDDSPRIDEENDVDFDGPVVLSKQERIKQEDAPSGHGGGRHHQHQRQRRTKRLHMGDELQVYVKSVSKQSSQLHLTLSSQGQGRKARDVKRETESNKKLARLKKQVGGLKRIQDLQGQEMNGIVKALSHTGDWLYVQPMACESNSDDDDDSPSHQPLPVGIATLPADHSWELQQGDSVLVRLNGIDESRGQLALQVLDKISP